ncbi:MAG: heat-inducible transcriptional repressor HrcA [Oscillospiraceae bacterium]|nr:heat-inducible transcriptional repressor HrcA [Oscillospiraceae bacterium]
MLNPSLRKQRILAAVVELYNATGEPVGSKRLMEVLPDDISSATIRNEMAQLAELGFLEQPHTSAGRIPSPMGYRYYIDNLLPHRELPSVERARLESELRERAREPERLLENAGKLLAELTACTALCVPATGAQVRVKRIEIAPLGRSMAMLALLTTGGAVKSKVIRSQAELTPEALEVFVRLAKDALIGAPLDFFTQAGIQSLAARAGAQFLAVAPLLAGIAELAEDLRAGEMLVGMPGLAQQPQWEQGAQALLQHLQSQVPQSLKVLLGAEVAHGAQAAQAPDLRNVTLVVTPYAIGQQHGGLLGIIGPLRMDYARAIPGLRFIASILGKMLSQLDE